MILIAILLTTYFLFIGYKLYIDSYTSYIIKKEYDQLTLSEKLKYNKIYCHICEQEFDRYYYNPYRENILHFCNIGTCFYY